MSMRHTMQAGYEQLRRTDVVAADTVMDGSTTGRTYAFDDKPATAKKIGPEFNYCEILFGAGKSFVEGLTTADATADKDFAFTIWAWADGGPAVRICDGTGLIGQSRMFKDSSDALWCCSMAIDSISHVGDVTVADVDSTIGIAKLVFDVAGYSYIHVEYPDISAPVNAYVRPF